VTGELPEVPDSVESAEEARLIWAWMSKEQVRIIDATGTLALPAEPVSRLKPGSGRQRV
jgi:hypothetical protein